MKKIVVTLLLAAILLAMTPMSATLAEASYATVQSGNQYGVRLRLGPGTNYASQTTLPSGTVVTVLEKGTVWTRIQAGTLTGYMMSKFLVSSVQHSFAGHCYRVCGQRPAHLAAHRA